MFFNKSVLFAFALVSSMSGAYMLFSGQDDQMDTYIIKYVDEAATVQKASDSGGGGGGGAAGGGGAGAGGGAGTGVGGVGGGTGAVGTGVGAEIKASSKTAEPIVYVCKYHDIIDYHCQIEEFTEASPKKISDKTTKLTSFSGLSVDKKYKLKTTKNKFQVDLSTTSRAEFEVYDKPESSNKLGKFLFEYKNVNNIFEGHTNLFLVKHFDNLTDDLKGTGDYKCSNKSQKTPKACEIFTLKGDDRQKLDISTATKLTNSEDLKNSKYYVIKFTADVYVPNFLNGSNIFVQFTPTPPTVPPTNPPAVPPALPAPAKKPTDLASFEILSAMTKNATFDTTKTKTIFLN